MDFIQDRADLVSKVLKLLKLQRKSDYDSKNARRETEKFIADMEQVIDIFNLLPFEIMTVDMVAHFIANHLYLRAVPTDLNKTGSAYRQMMDNLKKKNYFRLFKSGLTDAFIISKNEITNKVDLKDKSDYALYNNLPDAIPESLMEWRKNFLKCICYDVVSNCINCDDAITDMRKNLKDIYNCALNGYLVNSPFKFHTMLQAQTCLIDTFMIMIRKTILLFILYNDNIKDNDTYLEALLKYADNLNGKYINRVNKSREKWAEASTAIDDMTLIKELSLDFSYYLYQVIQTEYESDLLEFFREDNHKSCMKYDDSYEFTVNSINDWLKRVSESDPPVITELQLEKVKSAAEKFYYDQSFDSKRTDFEECLKAFFFEIFVCRPVYKEMSLMTLCDKDNWTIIERIFVQNSYDRGHFRQSGILENYDKFTAILTKLSRIAYESYRTLSPTEGVEYLIDLFRDYLKFYNIKRISRAVIHDEDK